MKRFLSILLSAMFVFVIACGGGQEASYDEEEGEDEGGEEVSSTAQSGSTAAAPAAPAPVAADAATLTGVVKFEGAAPAMPNIAMGGDPACHQAHTTPAKAEDVVLGPGGELANVFVYIKPDDVKGSFPAPSSPALLDQKGCQYSPHVSAVQVGQLLQIKNSDATLHNVHAMPQANKEFNIGQPVQGMVSEKTFDKPEVMVKFKCDVHGWMNAYLAVMPHPFHGVSKPDGTFSIQGLPPGTYTLEAWHEKFGKQSQQITVGPKESKAVAFTFKA